MAILAYDDVMLREPALLTPRCWPVGLCKANPAHPARTFLIYGLTGRTQQPDIKGERPFAITSATSNYGRWGPLRAQYTSLPNVDSLGLGNTCMILIGRRLMAAPASPGVQFGYSSGATNRLLIYLPYNAADVNFDFGNATVGSGRLVVSSPTFVVGQDDWWLFVADPGIGREIWRNGQLVASDASATATRPAQLATTYYNSGDGSVSGFHHVMLGFYIFNGLIPDRGMMTRDPYGILTPA